MGALLMDSNAHRLVRPVLNAADFYLESNQIIYTLICELADEGKPIDMLTVFEKVKNNSLPEQIGGAYRLSELSSRIASAANIEYHARIVKEHSMKRDGIRLCTDSIRKLYEGGDVFSIRNDLSDQLRAVSFTSYLRVRTADQVMADAEGQPDMLMLAGSLLRYNEVSILFAPPGVGKSIFAVQIADALSRGEQVFPEGILQNESQPMRTGFFDFELTDKEFASRYKDPQGQKEFDHDFSDNFFRIDCNPEFTDLPEGEMFDKYILREIESAVVAHKLEVIIIDNITAMASTAASDANIAIGIMNNLKKLRLKYNLTILVLAHTTKIYNKAMSMEMNSMGGASQIQNFANTIFAIGQDANDKNTLYIKQLKGRNGCTFDAENVIKVVRDKKKSFLCFEYQGQSRETDHLASMMDNGNETAMIEAAIEFRKKTGKGYREAAKAVNYPFSHVKLMDAVKKYEANAREPEFGEIGTIRASRPKPVAAPPKQPLDILGDAVLTICDALKDDPVSAALLEKLDTAENDPQLREGIKAGIARLRELGKNSIADMIAPNVKNFAYNNRPKEDEIPF